MADRRSEPADARPNKRARTNTVKPYTRDSRLWLEDGNIILVGDAPGSERLGFRVHRGLLALNAEFFNDLVNFAQPGESCTEDEVQLLELQDNAIALRDFLYALYINGFFVPGHTAISFDTLSNILQMATKYLCSQLRARVVEHLCGIYPSTSKRPESLSMDHPLIPSGNKNNHPLIAINMARENNLTRAPFLPTAFYLASQLPPTEYFALTPKLSEDDHRRLICGRSAVIEAAFSTAYSWLCNCYFGDGHYRECQRSRAEIIQEMYTKGASAAMLFTEAMPHIQHAGRLGDIEFGENDVEEGLICSECYSEWKARDIQSFNTVWIKLPSYFDLPAWTP